MDVNKREYYDRLVREVVSCCYEVSNVLGAGFLEKVYENALLEELRSSPLPAAAPFPVGFSYR